MQSGLILYANLRKVRLWGIKSSSKHHIKYVHKWVSFLNTRICFPTLWIIQASFFLLYCAFNQWVILWSPNIFPYELDKPLEFQERRILLSIKKEIKIEENDVGFPGLVYVCLFTDLNKNRKRQIFLNKSRLFWGGRFLK